MKTTAIICVYNEEGTVNDLVTKVARYSFNEIIVVNDGSTDKADEILNKLNQPLDFK
ncbi:MAG: glycosyltransferase [Draconibacterium sp.]|nr:glycosyltransferase [Draconibacterium sp.]